MPVLTFKNIFLNQRLTLKYFINLCVPKNLIIEGIFLLLFH